MIAAAFLLTLLPIGGCDGGDPHNYCIVEEVEIDQQASGDC